MAVAFHCIRVPPGPFHFARETGDVIPRLSPSSLRDEERRLGFDETREKEQNGNMPNNKTATLLLAILSIVAVSLLGLLFYRHIEFVKLRNDIRFANDISRSFEDSREMACKGGVTNAADILWKLHFPSFDWPGAPHPFIGPVEQMVERQRKAAVRGVIICLRTKTSENLGDDPEPWIVRFGSENTKDQLAAMKEPLPRKGVEK
jgi:hypothetical protein